MKLKSLIQTTGLTKLCANFILQTQPVKEARLEKKCNQEISHFKECDVLVLNHLKINLLSYPFAINIETASNDIQFELSDFQITN